MSSSATGVGMTICFLGAILLILTQKSSQKFGDVLGIMVLGFILFQNIVSTKTQQGMFRVTLNLLDYSQKNLPVGDLFLRSRTIKMERTYKKV